MRETLANTTFNIHLHVLKLTYIWIKTEQHSADKMYFDRFFCCWFSLIPVKIGQHNLFSFSICHFLRSHEEVSFLSFLSKEFSLRLRLSQESISGEKLLLLLHFWFVWMEISFWLDDYMCFAFFFLLSMIEKSSACATHNEKKIDRERETGKLYLKRMKNIDDVKVYCIGGARTCIWKMSKITFFFLHSMVLCHVFGEQKLGMLIHTISSHSAHV